MGAAADELEVPPAMVAMSAVAVSPLLPLYSLLTSLPGSSILGREGLRSRFQCRHLRRFVQHLHFIPEGHPDTETSRIPQTDGQLI